MYLPKYLLRSCYRYSSLAERVKKLSDAEFIEELSKRLQEDDRPLKVKREEQGHSSLLIDRSSLFDDEKKRQQSRVSEIKKMRVDVLGHDDKPECSLIMNGNVSTPYNCAMHVNELTTNRSMLALVDAVPFSMHQPIKFIEPKQRLRQGKSEFCSIRFLHAREGDEKHASLVNDAFWRTGTFLLGYTIESAFLDKFNVRLVSHPPPSVRSGSFVYDVDLSSLGDWHPSAVDFALMGQHVARLSYDKQLFEPLSVSGDIAKKMFANNQARIAEIDKIVEASDDGLISVYRMGNHVDLTRGPLISSTTQVARFAVTRLRKGERSNLSRVQGLALPSDFATIHSATYELLLRRARKPNIGVSYAAPAVDELDADSKLDSVKPTKPVPL